MLLIRTPSTLAREVMKAKKRNAVFAFLIFLRLQTSRANGCGGRICPFAVFATVSVATKKINTYANFVAERYICCSSALPQP